jgi:hypothetical protein
MQNPKPASHLDFFKCINETLKIQICRHIVGFEKCNSQLLQNREIQKEKQLLPVFLPHLEAPGASPVSAMPWTGHRLPAGLASLSVVQYLLMS